MKVSVSKDVFALVKSFKQRKSVFVRIYLHLSKVSSSERQCLHTSQKFQPVKVNVSNNVFALIKSFKQQKSVCVTMSLH